MEYTLTESEQLIAKFVAETRTANNRNAGIGNNRRSEMSDFEVDLQGFAGELAFCRLANVFPDLTVHNRSAAKGQDNGDCILNGLRIDVKTSKRPDSGLWVGKRKIGTADAYALMVGTFPTFKLIGLANTEDVIKGRLHNDSWVLPQDKLVSLAAWQVDRYFQGS